MSYYDVTIAGSDTAMPLNLSKRLEMIRPYIEPGISKILDGGCGKGDYVAALRERYDVEAIGIEFLEDKVAAFKNEHPLADWVSQGDLQDLPFDSNSFDIVILNEVLEHIPNEHRALEGIYRVLKPGGKLILFSPNRLYPFETHGVYMRYSDKNVPSYVPFIPYIPLSIGKRFFRYWARNYWPYELRSIVKEAGFDIFKTTYIWQTFENISSTQPLFIRKNKIILRKIANLLERTPLLKAFGVSQVIIAEKEGSRTNS